MSMFRHIARVVAISAIAILVTASLSAAREAGQSPVPTSRPAAAPLRPNTAAKAEKPGVAAQTRNRSALGQLMQPSAENRQHHLILQVNTNDPAAMNLALNNATNVTQYYKELREDVKVEIVTYGPGLHMLRDDTSPVKARIEAMALSAPEVSFKACGNTQDNMHKAENKDIPIIPQADVVKSGVVRVMELQEKGWTYVKP